MTRVANAVDKLFCGNTRNNEYVVFMFYYINIFFMFVTGTTHIGMRVQIKLRQYLKGQENVRGRVRNNNLECVKNHVFCHNHAPSFE
jgi:phage-related holin